MGRLLRLLLPLAVACAPACAIWPEPQTIQSGSSPLKIHSDFSISLTIPSKSAPADLHAAISRTQSYLKTDKLGRLTPDRGASDAAVLADAPSVRSLVLELADYEESEESAPIASISEKIGSNSIAPVLPGHLEAQDPVYMYYDTQTIHGCF